MSEAKWKVMFTALCAVVCILAYMLWGNGADDNGRADAIRESLSRIEIQQQRIDARLRTIETGLDSSIKITAGIAGRVDQAVESVGAVESRINSSAIRLANSAERIAEGESIIRGIQQRAKENPTAIKN